MPAESEIISWKKCDSFAVSAHSREAVCLSDIIYLVANKLIDVSSHHSGWCVILKLHEIKWALPVSLSISHPSLPQIYSTLVPLFTMFLEILWHFNFLVEAG